MFDPNDFVEFSARVRHEHDLRGYEWYDLIDDEKDKLIEKDMLWAKYPSDEDILKELGDVLFYVTALSNIFGGNLQKTMEMNMAKLDDREQRGVLKGSGDNR